MRGERGTIYLLCFTGYIRPRDGRPQPLHYYGWAKRGEGQERIRRHFNGTSGAALPTAMWRLRETGASHVECHVGRIWRDATRADERRLKRGRNASRRCLRCRRARAGARVGESLEELLARSVEWAAAKRRVRERRRATGGGGGVPMCDERRVCDTKRRFTTRKAAKRAARLSRQQYHEPMLRDYACPFCGGYHIGHMNRRVPS